MNRQCYLLLALLLGAMRSITAGSLVDVATATFGKGDVHATGWLLLDGIYYVAYAGYDATGDDQVRLGSFDPDTVDFDVLYKNEFSEKDGIVKSVDWLNISVATGAYLAAGGFTNYQGKEISVFRFTKDSDKFLREVRTNFNSANKNVEVFAVKWIVNGSDYYLAVGGNDDNGGKEIRIYSFDITVPHNPVLTEITTASASFNHGEVHGLDTTTVDSTIYLVAGGNEIASIRSEIKIYEFDPVAETLTLLETGSMNSGTANVVKFHMIGETPYLAAGGNDAGENAEIRIFTYDTLMNTLNLVAQASFDNGVVNSLSWGETGGTVYLVAGGDDGAETAEKRVYSFDADTNTLTELATASLNGGVVYATEFQNIDDTLYIAEGGDAVDPTEVERPFRIEVFTPVV